MYIHTHIHVCVCVCVCVCIYIYTNTHTYISIFILTTYTQTPRDISFIPDVSVHYTIFKGFSIYIIYELKFFSSFSCKYVHKPKKKCCCHFVLTVK